MMHISDRDDLGIESGRNSASLNYNGHLSESESDTVSHLDNTVYIRVSLPEHSVQKVLQFSPEDTVWMAKQKVLSTLGRDLRDGLNYGLYNPPSNGKAGKFLDEERLLKEYPLPGPIGFLEFKYKRRVYKLMQINPRKIKQLHSKANLKLFIEHVKHNNMEKITKFLQKGLDPNYHEHETGETPLTLAVNLSRSRNVMMALYAGGAHLDFRTKRGITAMHKAAVKGNVESIKTLLELGASPNYRDSRLLTPLYYCVMNEVNPRCVELLLQDHAALGTKDEQGWSEVHVACKFGRHQHLEHLLFYGADQDAQNSSGNTPLHVCAVNNQENCTRILLFRGGDKLIANFANQTPFDVAIIAGNYELAEVINSFSEQQVVPFREAPTYNVNRRSHLSPSQLSRSRSEMKLNSYDGSMSPVSERSMSPSRYSDIGSYMSVSSGPTSPRSLTAANRSKSMSDSYRWSKVEESQCHYSYPRRRLYAALPDRLFVCVKSFRSKEPAELALNKGDVVKVLSVGEDGYWEGKTDQGEGWFPQNSVQEVKLRRRLGSDKGHSHSLADDDDVLVMKRRTFSELMQSDGDVGPRTVVLHKAPGGGYGFVLRGARSRDAHAHGGLDFEPSEEFPALQYLERVDPGSVSEKVGLKAGDFILEINGYNVIKATHETTVDLIKKSLETLVIKVMRVHPSQRPVWKMEVDQSSYLSGSMTLPHKKKVVKAPAPPRRDPNTSLSVGKARSKSLIEGAEISYDEIEQLDRTLAEFDTDSINDGSVSSTPRQNMDVPKIASIRSRPRSARINSSQLEEMFTREGKAAEPVVARSTAQLDKPKVSMPKTYANPAELKRKMNQRKEFSRTQSMGDLSANQVVAVKPMTEAMPHYTGNMTTSRMQVSPYAESHLYTSPPPPSGSTWHAVNSAPSLQTHVKQMEQLMRENGTNRRVYESTRNSEPPPPSWKPPPPNELPPPPQHAPPITPHPPTEIVQINTAQNKSKSHSSTPLLRRESSTLSQDRNVTFADDKVFENAAQFMRKHPSAEMIVTADINHSKLTSPFVPEPDYDSDDVSAHKIRVVKRDYTDSWNAPPVPAKPQQTHRQQTPSNPSKELSDVAKLRPVENVNKSPQAPPVAAKTTLTPAPAVATPPAPPPPPPTVTSDFATAIQQAAAIREKRGSITEIKPSNSNNKSTSSSRIQASDLQAAVAKRQARVGANVSEQSDVLKSIEQRIEENKKKKEVEDPQAALRAAVVKRRQQLQGNNMEQYVDNIEKKISQTKKLQIFNGKVIGSKKEDKTSVPLLKEEQTKTKSQAIMATVPLLKEEQTKTKTKSRATPESNINLQQSKPNTQSDSKKQTVSRTVSSKSDSDSSDKANSPTEGGSLLAQAEKLRQKFLERKQSGGGKDSDLGTSPEKNTEQKESNPSVPPLVPEVKVKVKAKPTTSVNINNKANSPPRVKHDVNGNKNLSSGVTGVTVQKIEGQGLLIKPVSEVKLKSVSSKQINNGYDDVKLPPLISKDGNNKNGGNKDESTSEWVAKISLNSGDSNDSSADSMFSSNEGDSIHMTEVEVIPPPPSFNNHSHKDRAEDAVSLVSSVSTLSTLSSEREYTIGDVRSSRHNDQPSIPEVPEMSSTPPPPAQFGDMSSGTDTLRHHHHSRQGSTSSIGSSTSSMTTSSGNKAPSSGSGNFAFELKPLEAWSCDDVSDWLDSLQLIDYKTTFAENAIDGPGLAMLSKDEFKELGVKRIGHRMTMERAIKKLKASSNTPEAV